MPEPAGRDNRAVYPFTRRALAEQVFCLAGAVGGPLGFAATLVVLLLAAVTTVSVLGTLLGLVLFAGLTRVVGRGLGAGHRALAARLLGLRVAAPGPPSGSGWLSRGLRDRAGWRAVAYLVLKMPVALLEGYATLWWLAGIAAVSYPFWWAGFRNHPPGVRLRPVPLITPFGSVPVATFGGTVGALAAGIGMLLVAPWLARGAVRVDTALIRGLLGPGRLDQRLRHLEETRARAVDDTAALRRHIERDLHDGAQVRLAALAMNLGRAREALGRADPPPDVGRTRELLDAAHRDAKDALAELRDLVRGIHPPVLDNGLAEALATLAASAPLPVRLRTAIPVRPSAAIETIAYFCAAELLANAAKHSRANAVDLIAAQQGDRLVLDVADDGAGGARPGPGTGLAGLDQRVRTVDGQLRIASPAGGPTRITVTLPMRA
jgi:signal transduction histidine kinase